MRQKLKYLNQTLFPQNNFFAPDWIVLGVNNTCNLHCKMCDVGVGYTESNFYQNLMGAQPLHMPLELFKNIVDQTVTHFPKAKLGLAFTEPLVYKHLYEGLKYAAEKKMFTSVTTNALNLRKIADKLIDAELNELYVSLDGPADVHNEIRGYKLSFEKAMEGIDYLLTQKKAPKISVYCVITQWNYNRLQEFLNYFKNRGLHEVGFMHTNYTPDVVANNHNVIYGQLYPATASNMQDIDMNAYDLPAILAEIKSIKQQTYPFKVSFSPDITELQKLELFYKKPEQFYGKRCHDIFRTMMIKSNGEVIPAHGRCYNLTIGNIYQNNLQHIWNSSIISKFRKDVTAAGGFLPACSRCCSAFN
ncbi:MAG: radical SAM protein [Bacteroidia bacterium]|nr:radical SAM protein [Bacteroidia bacterium]